MTEKAIGAAVGARQSTINRIRHGHMAPTWEVGDALVKLAKDTPIQFGAHEDPAASRRPPAAKAGGAAEAAPTVLTG